MLLITKLYTSRNIFRSIYNGTIWSNMFLNQYIHGWYLLPCVFWIRSSNSSVQSCNEYGYDPSNEIEPSHGPIIFDENYDKSQMKMKAFTKHPKVIGHHQVLKNYVKNLTVDLKLCQDWWYISVKIYHNCKLSKIFSWKKCTHNGTQ